MMKKRDYEKFIKRYKRFSNCNLPVPFWDDERQVMEYIYFEDQRLPNPLCVSSSLQYPLEKMSYAGLYYSFNFIVDEAYEKNGQIFYRHVHGHSHAHSFEEVVNELYNYPESFEIPPEDEVYYSKQELLYLKKIQKYLQFIHLKDITNKGISRYKNKKREKYQKASIWRIDDDNYKVLENHQREFFIHKYYDDYYPREYNDTNKYSLIMDSDYNVCFYIEFIKEEVKKYCEVKNKLPNDSFKDNELVILEYYKIIESFKKE